MKTEDRIVMSRRAYKGVLCKALVTPAEPTDAMPGSKRKMQVMADRLERGELPHHPDDARDYEGYAGLAIDEQLEPEKRAAKAAAKASTIATTKPERVHRRYCGPAVVAEEEAFDPLGG
jgi:hypothetical protein